MNTVSQIHLLYDVSMRSDIKAEISQECADAGRNQYRYNQYQCTRYSQMGR